MLTLSSPLHHPVKKKSTTPTHSFNKFIQQILSVLLLSTNESIHWVTSVLRWSLAWKDNWAKQIPSFEIWAKRYEAKEAFHVEAGAEKPPGSGGPGVMHQAEVQREKQGVNYGERKSERNSRFLWRRNHMDHKREMEEISPENCPHPGSYSSSARVPWCRQYNRLYFLKVLWVILCFLIQDGPKQKPQCEWLFHLTFLWGHVVFYMYSHTMVHTPSTSLLGKHVDLFLCVFTFLLFFASFL